MTPTHFLVAIAGVIASPFICYLAYRLHRWLGCWAVMLGVAALGCGIIGFIDAVEYLQAAVIAAH